MRLLFLFLFLLCGCSPIKSDQAKEEVVRFHELYQNGEYSSIYSFTSKQFRASTSEGEFIDIMKEMKEKKLGRYNKSTLKIVQASHNFLANNEVTLIYYSEYSKKIVKEMFVFEVENGKPELKGYRFDSIN